MNSSLNPLERRERHVIKKGTEILGGVLLTRAGIVVDTEENPSAYQFILETLDLNLASEETKSIPVILKAVDSTIDHLLPYDTYEYKKLLKDEAEARGVQRLTPSDEIGLSKFIAVGGICHQHALLTGATLRLLQDRRDISGTVSLESTLPDEFHPDRHTRVSYVDDNQKFTLDIASGVRPDSSILL